MAVLFSRSLLDSRMTALIDWSWSCTNRNIYRAPSGLTVRAVTTLRQLHGVPAGTPIFFGHAAVQHYEYAAVLDLVRAGRLKEMRAAEVAQ